MSSYVIRSYTQGSELPPLLESDFFHSADLFRAFEQTRGSKPFFFVAYVRDDVQAECDSPPSGAPAERIAGQMLAVVRRRKGIFLPWLCAQGRVYGEGVYAEGVDKDEVLAELLKAVTRTFERKLCLYIEFSNLGSKMFGYKTFRTSGYFPVRWMQVSNTIAPKSDVSLSKKHRRRAMRSYASGTRVCQAESRKQLEEFYKLLRNYYRFKYQRIIPRMKFFESLDGNPRHVVLLVLHNDRVIGGCTVVVNGSTAHLWYAAARRQSFARYHPGVLVIQGALQMAAERRLSTLHFMNTGMPFRKNAYREFILKFGGKPYSGYRWFRVSVSWLNKLLKWIYRE